jgi:hypothetical protein
MIDLQTKSQVNRMFAAAGVRIAWRGGHPNRDTLLGLAVSIELAETDGPDREVRVLGKTCPFGAGVHRVIVFQDMVRNRANASQIDEYKVMAHVLVHEIGHVLERLDRHSDTGIMKARWTPADYQIMQREPLPFAKEDLEWIHNALDEIRAHRAPPVEKSD